MGFAPCLIRGFRALGDGLDGCPIRDEDYIAVNRAVYFCTQSLQCIEYLLVGHIVAVTGNDRITRHHGLEEIVRKCIPAAVMRHLEYVC